MLSQDILKKIRRIEIISKKNSSEVFSGEYHSAFKGRGMEFSEVREYHPGDEIRFIDWNVSSRMGKIYVKQFVEERELTVVLAVDLSSSLDFFSLDKSKKDIAAEISALISFTAANNKDRVGLLLFTDIIEKYIPPKRGRSHILRIIREILTTTPQRNRTSIATGLAYLNRVLKKKAIIFLISDFLDRDFSLPLRICGRKHDLIALNITDRREIELPPEGVFRLRDPESGEEFLADFGSPETRRWFRQQRDGRQSRLAEDFRKYNVDSIKILSHRDYDKPLFDFFLKRRRKYSR